MLAGLLTHTRGAVAPPGFLCRDKSTRTLAVVALVLSLALHGGLIVIAHLAFLRGDQTTEIIRISLNPGGGLATAPAGGGASTELPPSPPAAVKPGERTDPQLQPATNQPLPSTRPQAAPQPRVRAQLQASKTRRSEHQPPKIVDDPPAANAAVAAVPPAAALPLRPDAPTGPSLSRGGSAAVGRGPGEKTGSGVGIEHGHGIGLGTSESFDLRAYCVTCPKPTYPRIARVRGWQGTVDVDVLIAANGSVQEATVSQSSGHEALDNAALAVARRSRFHLVKPSPTTRGRIAYGFKLAR